ncbi:hybrid sensor histidine kinase/response regulator transcription factor [Pleomorphovibrio marinus]|uniref:hybrid sensor histidine kinase/response regulator transcription factor n=1 Tax=Pleomorphovibrio marinus TaxID=2164132 RepID=UPI000E0B1C23|nr:hybrid sensor histidine kinase/response regulator transcription factor [Pleomorphovibrio marinus]
MIGLAKIGRITLLLLVGLKAGFSGLANEVYFENLSGVRGLPKTLVTSIVQDKEGFLWIGTREGVFRFDGHEAVHFGYDPNDPSNSLPSQVVFDVFEDSKGRIWLGSLWGLIRLNKYSGEGKLFQPMKDKAHAANIIKSVKEDDHGNIWLGSESGIIKFTPDSERFELYSPPGESKFPMIQKGKNNSFWGITNDGLTKFDAGTGTFELISLRGKNNDFLSPTALHMNDNGILYIKVRGGELYKMDSRTMSDIELIPLGQKLHDGVYIIFGFGDDLWLSSGGGVQKVDMKRFKVESYKSEANVAGSLSTNSVFTTYVDHSGILWVGTIFGLNKAVLVKKPFMKYQLVNSSHEYVRKENQIQNVLVDRLGTVWLVNKGNGILWWDEAGQKVKSIPLKKGNPFAVFPENWALVEDAKGGIWVGCSEEKGLFEWNRDKELFIWHKGELAPTTITADINGNIWMGSYKDGLAKFDPKSSNFTYFPKIKVPEEIHLRTRVFQVLAGSSGFIWAAVAGMGVFQYDPQTVTFTQFHIYAEEEFKKISDMAVYSIHEDNNGVLWIGTVQGGLNRVDIQKKELRYFTTKDGLSSNRINSIVEDGNGMLWLGTDKGLSRFDPIEEIFHNFEKSDGLLGDYFLETSGHARFGKVYFGTNHGLVFFHQDSISEVNQKSSVYITQVKVLDKSISLDQKDIRLKHFENFLYIDFNAVNFHSPDKTQFMYRMEGVDAEWVNSGTRRFAGYSELKPGHYAFKVKVLSDNSLSEESINAFEFTILPPWWKTEWAYLGYAMLLLVFLYSFKRFTVKREQLKHALVLKQLEADKMLEIDHLKSRFFANISHEFRTPLTLILGPLEKIISKNESKNDQSIFLMMQRNGKRLQELINQLLDLSKLESGKLDLNFKPVALTTFLKVLVYSFSSLAERKQINYTIRNPQENPMAFIDVDKLEKIINNLISNSFKFSHAGGSILVSIRLLPFENERKPSWLNNIEVYNSLEVLEILVEDKGIGMSEEQLENIFNRFYQIEDSNLYDMGGSGIGLSLVKELVELYEGDIEVSSKIGLGTVFKLRLVLPLLGQEELAIVSKMSAIPRNNPQNGYNEEDCENEEASILEGDLPIVLLVEDNRDVRQFIFDILKDSFRVIAANDGLQGVEKAIEIIPDLILSDVMMPKMDGVELCQKLKNNELTAHIPIVLLTAKASGGSKIEGLQIGADDYIIKPFEASELLVRIHNLIENRKKLQGFFSQQIMLQPCAIKINSLDEQFLQKVLKIMEEKIMDHLFGVESLSEELGMSRMQLHRKLKALTKLSPGSFIRMMRLKRAAEILSKGGGNVAEVSWQVGFQDPSYFSKCFQKQFGKKPSEYVSQADLL